HRAIVASHCEQQSRQITVRLARADAPAGRPLREDEYVLVTWTIDAPEDETHAEGPDRRHARIRRLVQEATDQGAAPTIGDLATALKVSEPTIRRDLVALRCGGHPVQTRGSRTG
ncbi:MAG: DUF1670 domain-containing protein, partial [Anaerolineae bacterium]